MLWEVVIFSFRHRLRAIDAWSVWRLDYVGIEVSSLVLVSNVYLHGASKCLACNCYATSGRSVSLTGELEEFGFEDFLTGDPIFSLTVLNVITENTNLA
jgi:hypothetical protein